MISNDTYKAVLSILRGATKPKGLYEQVHAAFPHTTYVCDPKGELIYWEGDKYVGGYKNNVKEGKGTYTYADGTKYTGEYKNGVREGQGTYTFADGTTKTGIWKKGELVTLN